MIVSDEDMVTLCVIESVSKALPLRTKCKNKLKYWGLGPYLFQKEIFCFSLTSREHRVFLDLFAFPYSPGVYSTEIKGSPRPSPTKMRESSNPERIIPKFRNSEDQNAQKNCIFW